MDSFLRWAGSKKKLVKLLSAFWKPEHNRYIEPFMGSACLMFYLETDKSAVISDLNYELVLTFNEVKKSPKCVYDFYAGLSVSREKYLEMRNKNPLDLCASERAGRFIYLNRLCFNGLYRTNLRGDFNVPYSGKRISKFPTFEKLSKISDYLQNVSIRCCDFSETLCYVMEGDFVYLDPPYATKEKRIFNEYGPAAFDIVDVERLKNVVVEFDKRGVDFIVSYADCDEMNIFKDTGFKKMRISVRRSISGFTKSRINEAELFVTNINGIDFEKLGGIPCEIY